MTEVISKNDFFDFEAKYEGKSEEVTPAKTTDKISQQIKTVSEKIYKVFNCKGIVRIDFIYEEKQELPYMLEINTVPGQSAASIVPQQVAAMGSNLKAFYSLLLEECFV